MADRISLSLSVLPDGLAVCRLAADAPIPAWAWTGGLASVTRTGDELSIVCGENAVPEDVRCERGWRCLALQGPLDFGMTGILAALTASLAAAGIPLFALSTFHTDYLLVKREALERAIEVLCAAGHRIIRP
jgi:hypothetical protein